jgi:hypothetical protein
VLLPSGAIPDALTQYVIAACLEKTLAKPQPCGPGAGSQNNGIWNQEGI